MPESDMTRASRGTEYDDDTIDNHLDMLNDAGAYID